MEDLDNLELIAKENLELGLSEKELGEKFNSIGISEFKRAKARKEMAYKDLELNFKKKEFSVDLEDLLEKKLEYQEKSELEFPKEEIEVEKNFFNYFRLLSDIQIQIAEIQLEISKKEFKISKERLKIAYETIYAAKERILVSKKQVLYIEAIKANKKKSKIEKLSENYTILEETLVKDRADIVNDLYLLSQHEIELADLKKVLSKKLDQREKIRPKISNNKT